MYKKRAELHHGIRMMLYEEFELDVRSRRIPTSKVECRWIKRSASDEGACL